MDDAAVQALVARLEALEGEVRELKARLDRQTVRGRRRAGPCPECGSTRFVHASRVELRNPNGLPIDVGVTTVGTWAPSIEGAFEVFVCAGCGATAWYVGKPGKLEALIPKVKTLTVFDVATETKKNPYR